jgi:hypothetical protein
MKINDEPDEDLENAKWKELLEDLIRVNIIACGIPLLGRACVVEGDYMITVRSGCMFRVKLAHLESLDWVSLDLHPHPNGGEGHRMSLRIAEIICITSEEEYEEDGE